MSQGSKCWVSDNKISVHTDVNDQNISVSDNTISVGLYHMYLISRDIGIHPKIPTVDHQIKGVSPQITNH